MKIGTILWSISLYLFMLVLTCPLYLSITSLIQVKQKWWSKPVLYLVSWLILGMIIFIGDWGNLPLTLLVFLLGIWFCCEGSGWKRIVVGLMLASTVFAFNGLIDNCWEKGIYVYGEESYDLSIWFSAIFRGCYAMFLYFMIRSRKPKADFELSVTLWKLLFVLTIPTFGIVISLVLLRSPFSDNAGTLLADLMLFAIAALSFIGLIWAMLVLERQQALEQENALSRMNMQYYESMEQQSFAIRRIKHDLVNHLQTLLALPEEKRIAYIKEMLENKELTQTFHYSGDTTVNVVLSAKQMVMQQKGIHFVPRIEVAEELPFDRTDICALFANALDNAIEACEKLPVEQRRIHMEARQGKGILAVNIANPCSDMKPLSGKTEGKIPQTTKADTRNHGLGLKSIREVTVKYGGSMEISNGEGEFELFVYLPLEK